MQCANLKLTEISAKIFKLKQQYFVSEFVSKENVHICYYGKKKDEQ